MCINWLNLRRLSERFTRELPRLLQTSSPDLRRVVIATGRTVR